MEDAAALERMALDQDQRISDVVKREQSRLRNSRRERRRLQRTPTAQRARIESEVSAAFRRA